ncbi:MAG: protein kinase [Deltaproteobacteria bacterium]|nr:protein kinase [Deltaproteobacteria bacterium]
MRKFGKYRLDRKIATGGMAEIFLATQTGIKGFAKQVAIKRILAHLSEHKEFTSMFLDEARLVAKFNHPNIVQIFDLGVVEGRYFLAMEYIDGHNITHLLKACENRKTEMPLELAIKITSQTARGLDYAHNFRDAKNRPLNMIHRDISPQNIMLTYDGAVKVVDFGIAKAASNLYQTQALSLRGKVKYMSPEQITRKLKLDRRSDIYSLGVVLCEFVTGQLPHEGTSELELMTNIVYKPAADPRKLNPSVPDDLATIINKALHRDREQRYQNCRDFQNCLDQFLIKRRVQVDDYDLADFLIWALPKPSDGAQPDSQAPPPSLSSSPSMADSIRADAEDRTNSKAIPLTMTLLWLTLIGFLAAGLAGAVWFAQKEVQTNKGSSSGQVDEAWAQELADKKDREYRKKLEKKFQHHLAKAHELTQKEEQLAEAMAHLEEATRLAKKVDVDTKGQTALDKMHRELQQAQQNHERKQKIEWRKKYNTHITAGIKLAKDPKKGAEAEKHLAIALDISSLAGVAQQETARLSELLARVRRLEQESSSEKRTVASRAQQKWAKKSAKYRKEALVAQNTHEYKLAVMLYKKALEMNPEDLDLYRMLGDCYAAMDEPETAISNYKAYIRNCQDCTFKNQAEERLLLLQEESRKKTRAR